MSLSLWRYSHLVLALFASVLLSLAAVTGIVLAVEPMADAAKGCKVAGADTLRLSEAVPALKKAYPGIQQLAVTERGFMTVKWNDEDGAAHQAFVDPRSGRKLGDVTPRHPLFEWTTTLHRSLFLHETGRMIMGVTAGLLILIAGSGAALMLQRQRGLGGFFAPVERSGFSQYYHVVSGRVMLPFILALAATGGYLSVSRFMVKPVRISPKVAVDDIAEAPRRGVEAFPVFLQTRLADVQRLDFPFSEFPEDYFTLKQAGGERCINQFTGDILAQSAYSRSYRLGEWSLAWHTGRASVIWALIMAISSGYVLFFIYTGFAITISRRKGRIRNRFNASEASIVILVGSENGSTMLFAKSVYRQLIRLGQKVYMSDLNDYRQYPHAAQLLVMTSTYGQGDAPANAKRFLSRLDEIPQLRQLQIAVLGFGSKSYPQFCRFATDVHAALSMQDWAVPAHPLMTVNNRSLHEFSAWLDRWSAQCGFALSTDESLKHLPSKPLQKLSVAARTQANEDGTFTVRLKSGHRSGLRSGDLLAIYPTAGHTERLYSIAYITNYIELNVRLHEAGLGSGYLYSLNPGARIAARIVRNTAFHFPKSAAQVIMIANGTGIAPFQGMIAENRRRTPIHLYCGFRTSASIAHLQDFIGESLARRRLRDIQIAYSREGGLHYVSELLKRDAAVIGAALRNGAVIMICGSLSMQRDVCAILDQIGLDCIGSDSRELAAAGRLLMDCY
jgi:sulfite reductase (NADPH) flavoprotein alpha-component